MVKTGMMKNRKDNGKNYKQKLCGNSSKNIVDVKDARFVFIILRSDTSGLFAVTPFFPYV